MKRLFIPASGLWLLVSLPAHALIDTNTNGLSDLWEKAFNANTLFSAANPDHDPAADPDGDDWTNLQEAAAGTDPFDASAPGGFVLPWIAHTPGTFEQGDELANPDPDAADPMPILIDPPTVTLTWPSLAGKAYQVAVSENLVDWTPASGAFLGAGIPLSYESQNLHADGNVPSKLFLRVAVSDTDTDGDNLSDWEEGSLGTNPNSPDTDRDGIPDDVEITNGTDPNLNQLHLDPDGIGLANAGLMVGLKANWTFEEANIPIANLFGKFEARCENMAPATTPSWPVLVPFQNNGTPGFLRRGFVSQGLPIADKSIFGDGKVFTGITNSFTLSFWHRFQKDSVKNGDAIYKCIWSLSDCRPAQSSIASNTLAIRRKSSFEEEIYLGAYIWNATGGVPSSSIIGKSFTRPLGTADDGNWHQYTIVRTAGKYTLYIDGEAIPGLNNQSIPWLDIPLNKPTPTTPTDYNYDWNSFGRMAPSLAHNQTLGTFDRIRLWSRPLNVTESTALYREDIDKDGLWDVSENKTAIWTDADQDNNREDGEYGFISSPLLWENTVRDTDGDGLTDLAEQNVHQTDIAHPDTDGDLLPDGWEITNSLDPLNTTGIHGGSGNPDNDGLSNLDEYSFVSDPRKADTDGDGVNDGPEVAGGSNPSDPGDNGLPLPAAKRVSILLGIGDQSGSDSEDYVMNIHRIDPVTGAEIRFHTHRSGGHGSYHELTRHIFRKGETYTFQIDWQSSTQGSSGYDPNAPGKGPDYDYTFKVQPQGTYLGKLIPSWDSATGATNGTALAVTGASNVATTQQEFETNYERRRVAIVAPKLEWQAIEGFDNLDTHIDPWTNTAKGKRIFPCRKNPDDNQLRHKLKLVATGGLKGVELFVKSFDIDDSTDEAFDIDFETGQPVIDSNDKAGNDNLPDDLETARAGHFWNNTTKKWGGSAASKTFGSDGRVVFDYRIGMQPGSNYRTVAAVGDATGYASVHVLNDTQPGYLGYEIGQNGGAIASEPLTVWRRLWVENDSMKAIGIHDFGYPKNDLSSDIDPRINLVEYQAASHLTYLKIPRITDYTSYENLENGKIIVNSIVHNVNGTDQIIQGDSPYVILNIRGDYSGIPLQSGFRLYDDDGYGLSAAPLPRTDLVADDWIKKPYKMGFIDIIDANAYGDKYNKRKLVDFFRNHPVVVGTAVTRNAGVWDDSIDMFDSRTLWVASIIAGYQGGLESDGDPKSEGLPDEGLTPGRDVTFNGDAKYSVVYIEQIRDIIDEILRAQPQANASMNTEIDIRIKLTAAHEIGHHPRFLLGDAHHDEQGLMGEGGYNAFGGIGDSTIMSAKSIRRFRNTHSWRQE